MDISAVRSVAPVFATSVAPEADRTFPKPAELANAVQAVNNAALFGQDSELTFVMDRESKRYVVQLVNRDTRKVIRQIPPEYLLRLADTTGA